MDANKLQQSTDKYKSQVFFDGDVLTAAELNNVIKGIDECMQKVPDVPEITGQYFLSAISDDPNSYYGWIKKDPITLYRDPNKDGNVIIGEDTSEV